MFSFQVRIQLQDYDEQQHHLRQIKEESPYGFLNRNVDVGAEVSTRLEGGNDASNASVAMSMSEDKNVQTDKTYSVRNAKIQTIRIDESDSDDDPDIANQSLSQSMMSAVQHNLGMKSFNDPGMYRAPSK